MSASFNMGMTLFFGEASQENVRAIKAILRIFELASGLKINFAKNFLVHLVCRSYGSLK